MSDREIIEFLAAKLMGWRTRQSTDGTRTFADTPEGTAYLWGDVSSLIRRFNPLESIADAFECQANLPEDKHCEWVRCLLKDAGLFDGKHQGFHAFWLSGNATPRQRCLAIVKALGGEA